MPPDWLRRDRTRQEALREDLVIALVIAPLLGLVLVAIGQEAERVVAFLAVWCGAILAAGFVRFAIRSRRERGKP